MWGVTVDQHASLAPQCCAAAALLLDSFLTPCAQLPGSAACPGRADYSSSHILLIFVVSWKSTDKIGLKTTQSNISV